MSPQRIRRRLEPRSRGPAALRLSAAAMPPSASSAPAIVERSPAIIFEPGREAHGDDRHDDARIGGLCRADLAHHGIIEAEGQDRGEQARDRAAPPNRTGRGSNTGGPVIAKAIRPSISAPAAIDQASSANSGKRRISGPRLHHVGDRRRRACRRGSGQCRRRSGCVSAGCSRSSWTNSRAIPATATSELHAKRAARPMAEQGPAEQARRDQQQREHGRDDARGDVPFGEIDGVEVDAELREAEERSGEQALPADAQASRPSSAANARHRDCRNDEAVGHRPLRRRPCRAGRGSRSRSIPRSR